MLKIKQAPKPSSSYSGPYNTVGFALLLLRKDSTRGFCRTRQVILAGLRRSGRSETGFFRTHTWRVKGCGTWGCS